MVVIVHCHHFHFVRRELELGAGGGKVVLVDETKSLCVADTNESLQGESHRTLKFIHDQVVCPMTSHFSCPSTQFAWMAWRSRPSCLNDEQHLMWMTPRPVRSS